jgi:enoyl-CoA hydratase
VDKDKQPRWRPATLAAIDAGFVDGHFQPPRQGDLTFDESAAPLT